MKLYRFKQIFIQQTDQYHPPAVGKVCVFRNKKPKHNKSPQTSPALYIRLLNHSAVQWVRPHFFGKAI